LFEFTLSLKHLENVVMKMCSYSILPLDGSTVAVCESCC